MRRLWAKVVAGFGQGGSEYRQMAGHDSNYIALSGPDDSVLLCYMKIYENSGEGTEAPQIWCLVRIFFVLSWTTQLWISENSEQTS